ncbi:MAG TPA: TIGR03118 family protein [Terriglobales bacterium]|nr:TIGR03118 family protein [Terriglobales bacterium]
MWTSVLRRAVMVATAFALLTQLSAVAQHYLRTDLTTDVQAVSPSAPNVDPNLVNSWGLARASGSPWWIADNGTGLTTLYNAAGVPQTLVVTIPTPDGTGTAAPTGAVFNETSAFNVAPMKPAVFLFVTEDGTISGWNPGVNLTKAVLLVNRAGKAIYKGCAIGQTKHGPRFYATNFVSGRVEIFDDNLKRLHADDDAFRYPGLGRDWSPFNIQNVGGSLVVTFAHRAPGSEDEDHGTGLGRVGVYDLHGHLLLRLEHGSWFNAPWGVALAPGDFGKFSHRLLVGNFGDGTLQAFNIASGRHEDAMLDEAGKAVMIDGLWAISFGGVNPANNGPATTLFFTSGPNDEADGVFGQLTPVAGEQPGNTE